MPFKMFSVNAKELNTPVKGNNLIKDFYKENGDILFIQETHLLEKDKHRLISPNISTWFHSHSKKCGTSIAIRNTINFLDILYRQIRLKDMLY